MVKIQLSKRNLLAILAGFITTLIFTTILTVSTFIVNNNIVSNYPYHEWKLVLNQQPYLTFVWAIRIIPFLEFLISGFIVGRIAKENGWIYGGLLGALWVAMAFIFSFGNIHNPIILIMRNVLLAGFGGYLGGLSHKRS